MFTVSDLGRARMVEGKRSQWWGSWGIYWTKEGGKEIRRMWRGERVYPKHLSQKKVLLSRNQTHAVCCGHVLLWGAGCAVFTPVVLYASASWKPAGLKGVLRMVWGVICWFSQNSEKNEEDLLGAWGKCVSQMLRAHLLHTDLVVKD